MNRDEIIAALIESVEKVTRKPVKRELIASKSDLHLNEALGLDSLDLIEIVDELNRRFDIELNLEKLAGSPRLDTLMTLITAGLAANEAELKKVG